MAFKQPVEGAPIRLAWEQLLAVDEVQQRHRLLAQGVDDVPIIDDMAVLAVRARPAAAQRHEWGAADQQVQAVVILPYP
jgi:hypothetical protein